MSKDLTNPKVAGFLKGYNVEFSKVAAEDTAGVLSWGADKTTDIVSYILNKLKTAAIVAPVMAGVGTGVIHSSLTSPGNETVQTAQKTLLKAELEKAIAELERKKEIAKLEGQSDESSARELRV